MAPTPPDARRWTIKRIISIALRMRPRIKNDGIPIQREAKTARPYFTSAAKDAKFNLIIACHNGAYSTFSTAKESKFRGANAHKSLYLTELQRFTYNLTAG